MKSNYFLVGVILALLLVVGVTWAMAQTEVTQYHACVNNASGTIHIMNSPDETCNNNEELIVWDRSGAPGPPGPPGVSQAYVTGKGDTHLTEEHTESWVDVMTLNLPQGFFISNVVMQADLHYGDTDAFDSFLDCDYEAIDPEGNRYDFQSVRIGGSITPTGGRGNFASTFHFNLYEPTQLIVTCQPWFSQPGTAEIVIGSSFWTVIQVDNIDIQDS